MAVKSTLENDKLLLEIDNGDLSKLEDAMQKWSFKDHQSLLRFSISILLLNESKSFPIFVNGVQQDAVPSKELIKS